jgi:hypothetical protein
MAVGGQNDWQTGRVGKKLKVVLRMLTIVKC